MEQGRKDKPTQGGVAAGTTSLPQARLPKTRTVRKQGGPAAARARGVTGKQVGRPGADRGSDQPSRVPLGQRSREDIERVCARAVFDNQFDRVYFKDLDSKFVLVSPGWVELVASHTDLTTERAVGLSDADVFRDDHAADALADEQRIIASGQPMVGKVEGEFWDDCRAQIWLSTTKMALHDEDGAIVGTWGISRDITAQIEAEQALEHQALHDRTTGLPNRLALRDRLAQALLALGRNPGRVGLLFIDLDNLKVINDSLGHRAGDKVLVEMARRLLGVARRVDTVARFGGDEFVILYSGVRTDEDIRVAADRVVRTVAKRFVADGQDLSVTGSVGVVITDNPEANPDVLLAQADAAMYQAKDAGRNRFRVYDRERQTRLWGDSQLQTDLRQAIQRRELFLLYQPVFCLEDHQLCSAEALVRWNHPQRGLILPADFIPLAEETGLIRAIDDFVLDEACKQLAQGSWPEGFSIAVNLSGRHLADPRLPRRVADALRRHGVRSSQLCLEITETAFVGEVGDVEGTVGALKKLGVQLALDDFGTGYSTLVHLQQLPVDILKIDRSFVQRIDRSRRDGKLVMAIIALAHALDMTVVGEGIETDRQRQQLAGWGCDRGQGFLLARPVPIEQVKSLSQPVTALRASEKKWSHSRKEAAGFFTAQSGG